MSPGIHSCDAAVAHSHRRFGLPLVLAGTMAPSAVGFWVFVTSYVFIGIEEVGVQVEQPFEIVPMTQLCRLIMANLEEAFLQRPPPGM